MNQLPFKFLLYYLIAVTVGGAIYAALMPHTKKIKKWLKKLIWPLLIIGCYLITHVIYLLIKEFV